MMKCWGRIIKSVILRKPLFCVFRLTHRCNLRCVMCGVRGRTSRENELTLPEIAGLGNILKKLNITVLVLGGGEPFLRADLPAVIKVLSRDFLVRMQTNGVLAEREHIIDAIRSGLTGVSVSLDTLTPRLQDDLCGQEGVWYKIVEKMILFARTMPRNSVLLANIVVSRFNLGQLPSLAKFINAIGFVPAFIPVLLSDSPEIPSVFRGYAPHLAFRKEDYPEIERIYTELIRMKKKGVPIANSFAALGEAPAFFKENRTWPCDAARLYFHIEPDGSFSPCSDLKAIASVFEEGFEKKFYSRAFQDTVRQHILKCPNCMHPCQVEVSKFIHNPAVFFEKIGAMAGPYLHKRKILDYADAIRWALR